VSKRRSRRTGAPIQRLTHDEQVRAVIGEINKSSPFEGMGSAVVRFYLPVLEHIGFEGGFILFPEDPVLPDDLVGIDPANYWPPDHHPEPVPSVYMDVRMTTATLDFVTMRPDILAAVQIASSDGIIQADLDLGAGSPDSPMSVAVVTTLLDGASIASNEAAAMATALDYAVETVRNFQKSLILTGSATFTLLTRQRLGLIVPYAVRDASEASAEWRAFLYVVGTGARQVLDRDPPASGELRMSMEVLRRGEQAHAQYTFVLVRNDANLALEDRGDFRTAIILAAVAAETYLDNLLVFLLMEEGKTTDDMRKIFATKRLVRRSREEFHPRLGGNWSTGAIGAWRTDLNDMRNRIMHIAAEPTEDEAKRAVAALDRLESYVVDRLAASESRRAYPRTCVSFAGFHALQRRGAWSSSLSDLEPASDDFLTAFMAAKREVFSNLTTTE
jgi:hypothetical protein